VEPDFFVRDMLTWALIHHDGSLTLDRVLPELRSPIQQARSQALHTLYKLADAATPVVQRAKLHRDAGIQAGNPADVALRGAP